MPGTPPKKVKIRLTQKAPSILPRFKYTASGGMKKHNIICTILLLSIWHSPMFEYGIGKPSLLYNAKEQIPQNQSGIARWKMISKAPAASQPAHQGRHPLQKYPLIKEHIKLLKNKISSKL